MLTFLSNGTVDFTYMYLRLPLEKPGIMYANLFTIVHHHTKYIRKQKLQKAQSNQSLPETASAPRLQILCVCKLEYVRKISRYIPANENCTNIGLYVYVCTWGSRKPRLSMRVKETRVETVPVPRPTLAIWWSLAHSLGLPSASLPAGRTLIRAFEQRNKEMSSTDYGYNNFSFHSQFSYD